MRARRRRRLRVLGFLVVESLAAAGAARGAEPSIPLAEARQVFREARAASARDGGKLWGRPVYGPILLVDPVTRFVVADRADPEHLLAPSESVFVGKLPEKEGIANTASTWAGTTWTMLMWPLPSNRYSRTRLVMHECFHRIQGDLNIPAANPANSHLDTEDGRIWLRLEWRALAEALIRDGDARRRALEDALVFRAYRRSLFPKAALEERQLELNEGLAEYTGYKLSGLPDRVLADRAALRLEREEAGTDPFVRSFAYASGPAYGILLDETGTRWRKELGPGSDLGEFLRERLRIVLPADIAAVAQERIVRYDGAQVMARERTRAAVAAESAARNRARFLEGPVLVLPGSSLGYTFDPTTVEPLGDLGTVYRTSDLSGDWGTMNVTGGVLLIRSDQGGLREAHVPAPNDLDTLPTQGDGWMLHLNEGWKIVPGPRPGDYTLAKP